MLAEREGEITLKYILPIPGTFRSQTFPAGIADETQGRPPRIARLVALAHKLEDLVRSGAVSSYGELARLSHISPARLSQILILAQLAPPIQEYVLFFTAHHDGVIAEVDLRRIARDPSWDGQREKFARYITRR
jgi:hypothetical protein